MVTRTNYSPKQLYEHLSEFVVGQADYLKKVSITVWLHNSRIQAVESTSFDLRLQKHNLLCVGPTGSGKTLAITTLAKMYDLDVLIADMSGYTGTGWKGKDVDQLIKELYIQCKGDKRRTERSIIVMDEIDKLILQNDAKEPSFAAENALLKLMEGTKVTFEGNSGDVTIDTTNILFIAAGAFEGIESLIRQRVNTGKLGFQPEKEEFIVEQDELMMKVTRADLLKYGMGAQFLGRFADIAVLKKLNVPELTKILLQSKASVVKSLDETLRRSCGIKVIMDEEGAKAVAKLAVMEDTGARGLSQIISPVVNSTLFSIGDDQTVNGILLTAQDGEPFVKLQEGERYIKGKWKRKCRVVFPAPKRKNVEHFSWLLLSVYLEQCPVEYRKMQAMHNLLCNIVFYLLTCCDRDDYNLESIQKVLKVAVPEPENNHTLYEFMQTDEKYYSEYQDYVYYYKLFKILDPTYRTVPMLRQALEMYAENPAYPQGNATKHQRLMWKPKENVTH